MAYEKVHRVVVTDIAGNVVGLVSSIDVLRWLACHDGYAIP
jgi:predicted transcriptional regulator